MTRAIELKEEADALERAADFLHHQAMAKRRIAEAIEKIDAAGAGGGAHPQRLTDTRTGSA